MKFSVFAVAVAFAISAAPAPSTAGFLNDLDRIIKKNTKKKSTTRKYKKKSSVSSAQRQENKQIQTALNFFNFPVGTADGSLGPKSRNAISNYQAYMGFGISGKLDALQTQFLLGSYDRAVSEGIATTQLAAQLPDGNRGLLKHYAGETQTAGVAKTTPTAPSNGSQVEVFMVKPEASSIANYCNNVSLKTSTNGGFITLDTMTDPKQALDEQFCLARVFAIAKSEELVQKVQGVTTAQMEAQCQRLVPAFSQQISALSISSIDEVIAATGQQIVKSGAQPKQMAFSGSICLGIGYRTDNTELALASGLILTALGQQPYSELMGHHLNNGFGTTQRYDLSAQWYDNAVEAVKLGQPAVFAKGQVGRMDLIAAASKGVASGSGAAGDDSGDAFALPSFD